MIFFYHSFSMGLAVPSPFFSPENATISQSTRGSYVTPYGTVSHSIQPSNLCDDRYFKTALENDSSSTSSIWKTDPLGSIPMSPKAYSNGAHIADTTTKLLPRSQWPNASYLILGTINYPTKRGGRSIHRGVSSFFSMPYI